MSKKLSYLKCKLLSKITVGKTKEHYLTKKKRLKQQILQKEYAPFNAMLQKNLEAPLQRLQAYLAYQKFYLLFKQRYNIDIPADVCGFGNFFELIIIPLKDILSQSGLPLIQMPTYQYLATRNKTIYLNYLSGTMQNKTAQTWSLTRFQTLERKINKEGYNPQKSAIVINQNNELLDGLHRSSILLYKYGPDYEIPVVQVSWR